MKFELYVILHVYDNVAFLQYIKNRLDRTLFDLEGFIHIVTLTIQICIFSETT